jgi:CubicO group peptidase (beta-lactamase class C family)
MRSSLFHLFILSIFLRISVCPATAQTKINIFESKFGQWQRVESAITLLENRNSLIPIMGLDTFRVAALSIGSSTVTPFQKMLGNYTKVDFYNLPASFGQKESNGILKKLSSYNLVITGVHYLHELNQAKSARADLEKLLDSLSIKHNSVFVFFCSPSALSELKEIGHSDGLIVAYQTYQSIIAQELSAQMIFGGIGAHGKLPASMGNRYNSGDGLTIDHAIRLKYSMPEDVGLNSLKINKGIDSIVNIALNQKAFPGCNVLIAKDGRIIFRKAYGFHTYENRVPASLDDIYDLASVTKVSGALPAVMKLNEEGKYLLDEPFSTYWPDWRRRFLHPSNKSNVTVREMLAHQSGLVPFIPFYKQSMKDKTLPNKLYHVRPGDGYDLEVAQGLYLKDKFKKAVFKDIRKSPLKTRGKYVYSDLSVYLTSEVVTRISGMSFTEFLDKNFYRPLGATTVTYLPSNKFSEDQIVPTEYDGIYRKRLVHGSVHDESAAVLGGIAGNAGLFASANDLAKLVQMYVQSGTYGGKEYLKKSTFDEFNKVQYPQNNNRRALGFDKPLLNNSTMDKNKAYPCPGASPQSFGHSGFTGTFFWADPAEGLIYIFLSNRVYPTRNNNIISDLGTRSEILQFMYDQIKNLKN